MEGLETWITGNNGTTDTYSKVSGKIASHSRRQETVRPQVRITVGDHTTGVVADYHHPMTRVLLAEDDASISEPSAVRREGYEVEVREDGPTALDAGMQGGVDLVVLDLGLPGMDGLEVARRLRAEGHTVPILILTARADEVDAGLVSTRAPTTTSPSPSALPNCSPVSGALRGRRRGAAAAARHARGAHRRRVAPGLDG